MNYLTIRDNVTKKQYLGVNIRLKNFCQRNLFVLPHARVALAYSPLEAFLAMHAVRKLRDFAAI